MSIARYDFRRQRSGVRSRGTRRWSAPATTWLTAVCLSLVLAGSPRAAEETATAVPVRDGARNVEVVLFQPVGDAPPTGNAGLFVGVNDFEDDTLADLQYAVHDAIELAYLFVVELRFVPAEHCHVLLAGQPSSDTVRKHLDELQRLGAKVSVATGNKILGTFAEVCTYGAQPSDLLVVTFSSHGFEEVRTPYVMPSDGIRKLLRRTAIQLREIEDFMGTSQAGHRLLLVDACQERLSARHIGRERPGQPMSPAYLDVLKEATGQAKLASCSPGEYSFEHSSLGNVGHGIFSWAVLEGLRGAARADDQNLVRLGAVADYVSQTVVDWSGRRGSKQTPWLEGPIPTKQLALALRADDLVSLAASVRRQPLTGRFNESLRTQLTARLTRIDRTQEADRTLLTRTREFVRGQLAEDLFVPYLRGVLELRPLSVTAAFTVREGGERGPLVSAARVELSHRLTPQSATTVLGQTATDAQGLARIEATLTATHQSQGEFFASASVRGSSKSWRLPDFPSVRSWNLYVEPRTDAAEIENTIGMRLRLIPAGQFTMGTGEAEIERLLKAFPETSRESFTDEMPAHDVRITRPFYLGMYEVTVGQFRKFVEATGYKTEGEKDGQGGYGWDESTGLFDRDPKYSWQNPGFAQTDEHPVVNVSWNDAREFCGWLSRLEKTDYRLPTEAEWEYACRAGTTTWYQHGDDPEGLARVGNVSDGTAKKKYADWISISAEDGFVYTAPVGRFQANGFGLYDMHGNVYEWCADEYGEKYYSESPRDDPPGPAAVGSARSDRGGCWRRGPWFCRSAFRLGSSPTSRGNVLGFRVACSPSVK